jgi:hypothetical protein
MGDIIMMKKLLSILFSILIVFGMGTSALARGQTDKEVQEAYKLIEKTNKEIAHMIDKAVNEADKLQAKYYKDVLKLQKKQGVAGSDLGYQTGTKMNEVQDLLFEVEEELFSAVKQENTYDHLILVEDEIKGIASIFVSEEVVCENPAADGICKEDNGEKVYDEYIDITNTYLNELNKIITDVYNKTREMSLDTIIRVSQVGITGTCDWVAVDFAHLTVWIDPIRVVGG